MNVYVYIRKGNLFVYKHMERAFEKMLEDVGFATLGEYVEDVRENGVWVEWTDDYFSVDDGPRIEKVDYFE